MFSNDGVFSGPQLVSCVFADQFPCRKKIGILLSMILEAQKSSVHFNKLVQIWIESVTTREGNFAIVQFHVSSEPIMLNLRHYSTNQAFHVLESGFRVTAQRLCLCLGGMMLTTKLSDACRWIVRAFLALTTARPSMKSLNTNSPASSAISLRLMSSVEKCLIADSLTSVWIEPCRTQI